MLKEKVMAKKENNDINKKGRTKSTKGISKDMEFSFCLPGAMNVYVAGEFNGWDTQSLPMKKDKKGIWKANVKLPPGRYEYKLFADNAWVENLPDSEAVFNSFGTRNLVISAK
jgi:1,4-alpha-glucan branching enzyme